MPNYELEAERRERRSDLASLQREIDQLRWQVERDKRDAALVRWVGWMYTALGFFLVVVILIDQRA